MKDLKEQNQSKNIVEWSTYLNIFDEILDSSQPPMPYDNPAYLDYLKLNRSRQKRWLKTGVIQEELKKTITNIKSSQVWYIITEPWCGDAAHSIPFIKLATELNPLIDLKIVWRDTPPFMIENYLTNGGKSVPKLVIRDKNKNDLAVWGPRPLECQNVYQNLKDQNANFDEIKITLQSWYNKDKGKSIQNEITALLESIE